MEDVTIVHLLEGVVSAISMEHGPYQLPVEIDIGDGESVHLPAGAKWTLAHSVTDDRLNDLIRLAQAIKPQIIIQNHATSSANADVSVTVTVVQKTESCIELSGLLQNIKRSAGSDLADKDAAKLCDELDALDGELEGLEDAKSNERKHRGAVGQLKEFAEKVSDASDSTGKLVQSLEKGAEYAGKVVGMYNKIGPFFGFPPVPNPFSKQS